MQNHYPTKLEELQETFGDLLMELFVNPQNLYITNGPCIPDSKKYHGLKFQSVFVPDGFIACLFGPVPAKTHNSRLLQESELLQQLQNIMPPIPATTIYSLYGDFAYPQTVYLVRGF